MKPAILALLLLLLAIPLPAQPVITNQPGNQVILFGSNATFSVMVTGVGPFSYQWRLNGTNLPNNIINTVAGGQLFDGFAATNVILNSPQSTAVDSLGNLYIADSFNHVIRKVGTNGVAKIIAGTGSGGFSGDGGQATNATLWSPAAVILDTNGNLLIADSFNNRIRKVTTNGIISTMAGTGQPFGANTSAVGNGGQATNGQINVPTGLGLDASGNLFIADSGNHLIRKVATSGVITAVAGLTGNSGYSGDNIMATTARLNGSQGVAVDSSGNIYIADTYNNRIRKVSISDGRISTIVGTGTAGYLGDGGSATSARLNSPGGITVNAAGTVFYIADTGNHCVRKITSNIITTIAGTNTPAFAGDGGPATNANLNLPFSVSLDSSNNVFIADQGNNRVRKVGTNGIISTVAGRNLDEGIAATNGTLNMPLGIAQDPAGNLFIADTANARIRKMDVNGVITTFAGSGVFGFSGDGGAATNASLYNPYGVAADHLGNVFIADQGNNRVRKVDTNGLISTYAGNGNLSYSAASNGGLATNTGIRPYGVTVDSSGNLFIADINNVIRKVNTNGIISLLAGTSVFGHSGDGNAATNALIALAFAICCNAADEVFFAEWGAIRRVNTNGIITTFAGKGYTSSGYSGDGGPATNAMLANSIWGLWCDTAGNVFISDSVNRRLRKVDVSGIITTIAGNGASGFSGDGGSATNASMAFPRGITGDNDGNLYLADSANNRLRKISWLEYASQFSFTVPNPGLAALNNNYSVVITSASGSVTSSVANITLQLPPVTPMFSSSSNTMTFMWSTVSNLTYQLQYATNLNAPGWQNLGAPLTASSNNISTFDLPGPDSQRFYRVELVP